MVIITRDLEGLEFSDECPTSESTLIVSYNGLGAPTTVQVRILVKTRVVANHRVFQVWHGTIVMGRDTTIEYNQSNSRRTLVGY
jgi:hypothetical protein